MLLRPLATLLAASLTAGCPAGPTRAGDAAPSTESRDVPAPSPSMTPIPPADRLFSGQAPAFEGPETLVIRDAAAWRDAWGRLGAGGAPPAVDFGRDVVVLVALGMRPTGGHEVKVEGTVTLGADVEVRVLESRPGAGCMTTQALTHPVDVVRIRRPAGAVRVVPRSVETAC